MDDATDAIESRREPAELPRREPAADPEPPREARLLGREPTREARLPGRTEAPSGVARPDMLPARPSLRAAGVGGRDGAEQPAAATRGVDFPAACAGGRLAHWEGCAPGPLSHH